MTIIFRSYSGDGSSLRLSDAEPRHLTFNTSGFAKLDRDAVLRLHLTLGEWLHPQNLGPTNGQLATAVKALADAINGATTAVRPLWGPRGQYVDTNPGGEGHVDGLHPGKTRVATDGQTITTMHRPQECPGPPECTEDAPNPERAAPNACQCGHGWTRHGITGCFVRHCRCAEAYSPLKAPATAPVCEDEPPPCSECTHSYRMHRGGSSRCTHPAGCDCPRYRSTP